MYIKLSAPVNAQVEITSECNQDCGHCYNFWRNDKSTKPAFMTEKAATQVLTELASNKVFGMTITGGEPLLNFKVVTSLAERARSEGIQPSINSNLAHLTPEKADALKKSGVDYLLTSMLGPNETVHDCLAGRKGAFNGLVRNIRVAQDNQISVAVNHVVTKANLSYLRETATFVQRLGIKRLYATRAGCPGNCNDSSSFSLDSQEFREYLQHLVWIRKVLGLSVEPLMPIPLCATTELEELDIILGRRCMAGIWTCVIGCDGGMRPCIHHDCSYGNVIEEGVSAVWSRFSDWNAGHLPSECRNCRLLARCGGGCRMEAKTRSGSVDGLDPYAKPDNVPTVEGVIRKLQTRAPDKAGDTFVLKPFRLRKEVFGAVVVCTDNQKSILLDTKGTKVLEQLRQGEHYSFGSNAISWGEIKPWEFVQTLARNKVAKVFYKSNC